MNKLYFIRKFRWNEILEFPLDAQEKFFTAEELKSSKTQIIASLFDK